MVIGMPQKSDKILLLIRTRLIHGVSGARAIGPMASVSVSATGDRSEEHTSELQSLMRISYAVFCLKKKKKIIHQLYCGQKHTQYNTRIDNNTHSIYIKETL